jgi:hypothetical protein
MFEAKAVWKTAVEGKFISAGFELLVEVEPVSTNVMPTSMDMIMGNIRDGQCDGFIIDLGTSKKHIIKS